MHDDLKNVPGRILEVAKGALTQANQHAVYYDPGMEHSDHMCVINAALAGELFLKAVIAKEHPLLIFKDLFQLDDPKSRALKIEHIIEKGKTYGFEHLPKLLWVSTGERIPDPASFEALRKTRNAIQHFCPPPRTNFRRLALEFLYKNIDPLIKKHFDLFAIEHHEDVYVGYDYVVHSLIRHELFFSVPEEFAVSEIDLESELNRASIGYQKKLRPTLIDKGFRFKTALLRSKKKAI